MSFERPEELAAAKLATETNLERLQQMGRPADAVRLSVAEMLGAISSYSAVHYPLPYKRPDEPVIDLLRSANEAIAALVAILPAHHETTEIDAQD